MEFTPGTWKEKAFEKVQQIKRWLNKSELPYIVYSTVAGLTVWPLVEAVAIAPASQPLPATVYITLGSITGGIGANIIAEQLQRWRDQADKVKEEDVVKWISEKITTQENLREGLDNVLEVMGTIPHAITLLSRSDQDWFTSTLRGELKDLGNLPRYESILTGRGSAVAQGSKAIAVAQRAIASKANIGQAITGDNNNVKTIIHHYNLQSRAHTDQNVLARQIGDYLKWMIDQYGTIDLRGIKREGHQVIQLDLDTIYVPLSAEHFGKSELRAINLNEILSLDRRITITGGPGSGKTTVLLHIAWVLASAIASDNPQLAQERLGLQGPLPLPIFIPLSAYADYLRRLSKKRTPSPPQKRTLANFISRYLIYKQTSFGLPEDFFEQLMTDRDDRQLKTLFNDLLSPNLDEAKQKRLLRSIKDLVVDQDVNELLAELVEIARNEWRDPIHNKISKLFKERNVILLLDGLDEVPNESQRVQVRQAIEELVSGRDVLRVVVTCRTVAYKDRTAISKGFRVVRVNPLSDQHITALVQRAYASIYRHDYASTGQNKANELLLAIDRLESERKKRLGANASRLITSPLLIRLLLIVHFSERRLPEQRAELYMKATDAMLLPDYAPDEEIADRLGQVVGGSREIHREIVQFVAFHMHMRGEKQGREVSEDQLRQILELEPRYFGLIDDFISLTRLRGTLMEERLGSYRFIHLSFQEYLTARYLAEVIRSVGKIVKFLEDGPVLESWWNEPILLVAGYLAISSPRAAREFLYRLARVDSEETRNLSKIRADVHIATSGLAGRAFLEWQTIEHGLRQAIADRLHMIFNDVDLLNKTRPSLRLTAGSTLAQLGEMRSEIVTIEHMPFCFVPAGRFWMGSDDFDDELPMHDNIISHDYWISCHPVTVAQFGVFTENSGYVTESAEYAHDLANEPVRWVSWYDAMEFCLWLSQRWQDLGKLGWEWTITLPSEAEWEKAARGGLDVPNIPKIVNVSDICKADPQSMKSNDMPQRLYPWGNEDDSYRANYEQTTIGAVRCFPGGASPYGCQDMVGSTYEWTRSLWGEDELEPKFMYPYEPFDGREDVDAKENVLRVVRGGSMTRKCICTRREWHHPERGYYDHSFRIVIFR